MRLTRNQGMMINPGPDSFEGFIFHLWFVFEGKKVECFIVCEYLTGTLVIYYSLVAICGA